MVPVEGGQGLFDRRFEEVVPAGLAVLVEAAAAEVVLVGHALLAPGMVGKLQAGAEAAVSEERGAQAGAEGERQLDALALDGSVALDGGVVADAHRPLPALFQLGLERESYPFGVQISRRPRGSALDDARKTNRDAVEGGQELAQFVEAGQNGLRRGHRRREHALPLADRLAVGVQEHGLQPRTADVDGDRDGAGGVGGSAGRGRCGRSG